MKKIIIFTIFAFFVLFFAGCTSSTSEKPKEKNDGTTISPPPTIIQPKEQPPIEDNSNYMITAEGLSKKDCESAYGKWNECGSACRGAKEGTACIEVCVAYCECGTFNAFSCPAEHSCEDILPPSAFDGVGICKRIPKEAFKEPEIVVANVTKISINITVNKTGEKNITTKDRLGLLFADRGYIVILDDIYIDENKPKTLCALVSVISTGGEKFGSGKMCIGEDYVWTSPGKEIFRIRLVDISPADSESVKWADVVILK